jgi:hypothetical protein
MSCENTTLLYVKKTKLAATPGIAFIRYAQSQKIGKPNNLKVFRSMKTKGPK